MTAWRPTRFLFVIAVFCILTGLVRADYTVKSGDTLSSISQQQLGSSARWQEIAELNGIADPYNIKIGQTLKLPNGTQKNKPSSQSDRSDTAAKPSKFIALVIAGIMGGGLVVVLMAAAFATLVQAVLLKLACLITKLSLSFGKCFKLALIITVPGFICQLTINLLALANPFIIPVVALFYLVIIIYATCKIAEVSWLRAILLLLISWFMPGIIGLIIYLIAMVGLFTYAAI